MLYQISYILLFVLAAIGLAEVISLIQQLILRGKYKSATVSMLRLKGHVEDVELVLRSAVQTAKWQSKWDQVQVVLVDQGMDRETRRICEMFVKENKQVELCQSGDLEEVLKGKLICIAKADHV